MEQGRLLDGRRSETLITTAFKASRVGMTLLDPTGRFLVVNPAMGTMFGYTEAEMLTMSIADLSHTDDRDRNLELLNELVRGVRDGYEVRKKNRHKNGAWVDVLVTVSAVRTDDGELEYIVGQLHDLTEQLAAEQALTNAEARHVAALEQQANTDALTGLPNRLHLKRHLALALAETAGGKGTTSVVMCDLDHFKLVNDSYGHVVGDEVLVALGAMLSDAMRATASPSADHSSEFVARFGGDEFVVVLRHAFDAGFARRRVEAIARYLGDSIRLGNYHFPWTLSWGVVHADLRSYIEPVDALSGADAALYEAKRKGRDRVVLFDDAIRSAVVQQAVLANELRTAIVERSLFCAYQPIVTATGEVRHVEALARWNSRGSAIPPSVFIDVAERSGLIGQVGATLSDHALNELASFRPTSRHSPVRMALNVAGQQIHDSFARDFVSLVDHYGLDRSLVLIEITESSLLDPKVSTACLHQLADAGISIAIDDFGTGHSSFAYLRDLPVRTLKLDKSFIDSVTDNTRAAGVVAGMIDLAHRLELEVVAEGVEHQAQFEALKSLGCDLFQGYLFAKPGSLPGALATPTR